MKKCNQCGKEIKGKPEQKLMMGRDGYRKYDVCAKCVTAEQTDLLGRIESKGLGQRAHHMKVSAKTMKRIVRAVGEL